MLNAMRHIVFILALLSAGTASAQRFVKTANTLPDLVAFNPLDVHTNVFVTAGFTLGDDLGGLFVYNVSSAAATNAYSILKPTLYNGRWIKLLPTSSGSGGGGLAYAFNPTQFDLVASTNVNIKDGAFVTNLFVFNRLEIDKAFLTKPLSLSVTAGTNSFLPGSAHLGSYVRIESNVPTGSTLELGPGYDGGQHLIIHNFSTNGTFTLFKNSVVPGAGFVRLPEDWTPGAFETLHLIFDGVDWTSPRYGTQSLTSVPTMGGDLTPGYIPYAINTNTLSDSSWYRFSNTKYGLNSSTIGFLTGTPFYLVHGYNAAASNATGNSYTIVGPSAGKSLTNANQATIVGYFASSLASKVDNSIILGDFAAHRPTVTHSVISGANSVVSSTTNATLIGDIYSGYASGNAMITSKSNVVIGSNSGQAMTNAADLVYIGAQAGKSVLGTRTNETIIGSMIPLGNGDNTITLGNASQTNLFTPSRLTATGFTLNSTATDFSFRANDVLMGRIAFASGYTGGGTLYLSDDGTYKTVVAGTTINPTDNRIPYRSNATTFGDSPWHYISGATNTLGFNTTNFFVRSMPSSFVVAIGDRALFSWTGGSDNTVMGVGAATNLTSGGGNVLIGTRVAEELRTGYGNTIVGAHTLQDNSATNVNDNTAMGYAALLGGNENTAIGSYSAYSTIGNANAALGFASHRNLTTGSRNIAIGVFSARQLTTGNDNIMIGYHSGTNSTTGSDIIAIGRDTTVSAITDTNLISIGNYVASRGSNTAQIGTNGVTVLYLNGTVGWFRGAGTPEAAVTAPIGSFYSREDGGAGTTFYVKESGTGNTGWIPK